MQPQDHSPNSELTGAEPREEATQPEANEPVESLVADASLANIKDTQDSSEPTPTLDPRGSKSSLPFYRRNPLTLSFSIILVIVYGLTTFMTHFQGPPELIVALGGFYPPAVQAGEWWRFITASLLHGNPGHLFNNVAGLLIFGNLLEPVIGSRRLFALYVLTAFTGLGLSYFMLPQGMTFGASTIDYGLIGTYLALVLILRYRYNREAFLSEFRGAIMFVILFVGWNMLESATVNLWGHIGGLLGGIGFALWLVSRPKLTQSPQR